MADAGLFQELADSMKPSRAEAFVGEARLLRPERRQVAMRAVDLDGLLPPGHQARLVWDWAVAQDLSALYASIKARGSAPGRAAIDPALLLALWIYALIDAVGSAREIERLCQRDLAYMWLCGDVGVNHHALADFRSADNGMADRILAQSIMALQAEGTVQLETLAVDGVRVRAHAGQASFRRRPRIEEFERQAEERVALLKAGALPDAGPDAGQSDSPGAARDKRQQAAAMRAAEERAARIAAARTILAEREEQRQKRGRSNRKKTAGQGDVRVSTSDPECRVMKMADGGFRPAYNLQVTTDPFSGIIVATAIDCSGSDKGLLRGAVQAATLRHGRAPKAILADGGFSAASDIEWAHALATGGTGTCPAEEGPTLYVPLTASKHGTDPHAPRKDDGPGVAALRLRMASDDGKASYKLRCQTELPHARLRKNGLNQFTLRGTAKTLAQATWHAIANNLIIVFGIRSRRAAA